ncbi:MAG TPA: carboxypeptidase regulatory-like domain-containing protein [Vicinamibacteria bacterium]|nr:carboxypeptidase regulatory-like domain-containing protein [Vicinamibacteria bacterium]
MTRKLPALLLSLLLVFGSMAAAQTAGEIQGTVVDAQGLAMPGVTVTMAGAAVLGEQVAVTLADGTFRFRGLRRGSYDLRFDLQGFQTLNREGIIVEGNRTVTINVTLEVATIAETVTVTGESPVVDVRNTALSNDFGREELQDVPSATDVWAVLGQTPGVRMRGYDVGGSHKSQQIGYESFGVRRQNRVISDGVDSTEGTSGTGFYYDYYSIDEFTTSAAGADVEMTSPGSLVVMTLKSGGNEFSGLFHGDYEDDSFVSDNIDEATRARGFTGNPNLLFWETHVDVGGPIVTDKAWFYGFYNHFKIDKQISGVDPSVATDIGDFDQFGGKVTFQITDKDQFIGYSQYQLKEKPVRGLSAVIPPESILAQASWSWVHKAEWQRVWNDQAFSNVQVKHFGFGWPMVPAVDPVSNPPRIDQATNIRSGAGWNNTNPPFTLDRWKPQITATLNYYIPNKAGSHDWKFGFDWQIDSSQYGSNSNSGPLRYFDNSQLGRPNNADEIALFSVPENGAVSADNRNTTTAFFVQDTWSPSDRLTLNLGFRFGRQRAYYLDSELTPFFSSFFPTGTIQGQTLTTWNNVAPRLGVTYDLSGSGRTVVKAHYGRYYNNIADTLSPGNPANVAFIRFKFLDQNQNGLFDGAQELGDIVTQSGTVGSSLEGASGTAVNPDLKPAYADEFSGSVEHEIVTDTSIRFSYVRKQQRNDYGQWNRAQQLPLLNGQGIPCGDAVFPCPTDPFTGQTLRVQRVPDSTANAQDQVIDTFPGSDGDYDTIQLAFNRRFTGAFFVQGSFDYQWRDELRRGTGESTSPLDADPLDVGCDLGGASNCWQNHSLDVPFRQDNTNWGARLLARYVFPVEIALSGNFRYQSGWPWAPIHTVNIPGSGSSQVFLSNVDQNRSEDVVITDVRVEKGFAVGSGRISAMLDIYNLFNSNSEVNFSLRTGGNFNNIIATLDPRTLKIGVRYQF